MRLCNVQESLQASAQRALQRTDDTLTRTREALERNVASLEGGTHGFAFSSGMGCLDSIMMLFAAGDHFVCAENMYGGSPRLFDRILTNFGLKFTYVDCRDPGRIEEALQPNTRAIIVETPTNPMMRLTDLGASRPARLAISLHLSCRKR